MLLARLISVALLATFACAAVDLAELPDRKEPLPPEMRNVGIEEKLDTQLPLDLEFTDQTGKKVKLGDYFNAKEPVIITLNYYRCPSLCGLQLNGLVSTLQDLKWTAGKNFHILTISFDPSETPQLAKLKQQGYLREYGRPAAINGWDFVVGEYEPVQKILDAVGFKIEWNEKTQEWIHTAGLVICTPEGRISRYLYGVMYDVKTLRLSLVEAGEGKIGSPLDQILLFCYHYDAEAGSYAANAQNLMRASALLTLLAVSGFLAVLWRWEHRRRQALATAGVELPADKGQDR
jgi:protein SCO1/2